MVMQITNWMNRSNTIQEILYFCDTELCDIWEVNGHANHRLDEQVKHHPRDTLFLWHWALWYLRSKQSCKSLTGWTGPTHPRLLLALVIIYIENGQWWCLHKLEMHSIAAGLLSWLIPLFAGCCGVFWGKGGSGGGSMPAWSLGAWCRCGSVCVPGQELDMVCILVRVGWGRGRGHCAVWLKLVSLVRFLYDTINFISYIKIYSATFYVHYFLPTCYFSYAYVLVLLLFFYTILTHYWFLMSDNGIICTAGCIYVGQSTALYKTSLSLLLLFTFHSLMPL